LQALIVEAWREAASGLGKTDRTVLKTGGGGKGSFAKKGGMEARSKLDKPGSWPSRGMFKQKGEGGGGRKVAKRGAGGISI